MRKFLLSLFLPLLFFASPVAAADSCPAETSEQRIKENITPEDKYQIIEGEQLDLFIKNSNQLYNIGWQREQIARVWSIEAVAKHDNPRFQAVHLFFIGTDGCIRFYQGTYKVIVELLLKEDPLKFLEGKEQKQEPTWQAPAAEIRISKEDPGGSITTYITWYERISKISGARLVIDAPCVSACTIALSYFDKTNMCITARGSFGFHLGSWGNDEEINQNYTKMLVRMMYPEWVQKWIASVGGLREDVKFMYPEEMKDHIPLCEGESYPEVPVDDLVETADAPSTEDAPGHEPLRLPAPEAPESE
jgi:hypothetical protein